MPSDYLVRYGRMRHIGRFEAGPGPYERGQQVIVRTCRGTEWGEILAPTPVGTTGPGSRARILAIADPTADPRPWDTAALPGRLEEFQGILDRNAAPMLLIDVEPLLDDRKVVLHYLGAADVDVTGLREQFRAGFDLDVVFEAAGSPPAAEIDEPGGCGAGGCGSGGCGSGAEGSACSSCGVKALLSRRRPSSAKSGRTPVQG